MWESSGWISNLDPYVRTANLHWLCVVFLGFPAVHYLPRALDVDVHRALCAEKSPFSFVQHVAVFNAREYSARSYRTCNSTTLNVLSPSLYTYHNIHFMYIDDVASHFKKGWFQWYCRFFLGRRTDDDTRQISRWGKCAGPSGKYLWCRAPLYCFSISFPLAFLRRSLERSSH